MKLAPHRHLASAVFLAVLLSCTGDSPSGTGPATAPRPESLAKTGGDGQRGAPAGLLPDSLAVKVAAADGRPVPGAVVAWTIGTGGGTLSASSTSADAAGIARVAWTLGGAGEGTVTARVGSVQPVTFTATAVPVATVSVSRAAASVGRGDTLRLTAVPLDAAGSPLTGRRVEWSTSDPATASVDASGVVLGLAYGSVTITAASEGRTAAAALRVTSEDRTAPRLKALSISPAEVDVTSGPAQVSVTLAAADAGSGVNAFTVYLAHASPSSQATCGIYYTSGGVLASGSPADGVWKCTATIPRGAPAGKWQIRVSLWDAAGNQADHTEQYLRAAGHADSLVVVNSGPSTTPRITELSLDPAAVDVSEAAATVDVIVTAVASAGVRYVYAYARPARGSGYARDCQVWVPTGQVVTSGTWKCRLTIPRSAPAGEWKLVTVAVQDQAGTSRVYGGNEPSTMEFPATIQVTSRTEDLVPPVLNGISLSASSLDLSTGPKSVDVTVIATDAETGPVRAQVLFRGPNNSSNSCASDLRDGTAKTLAMKCTAAFGQSAPSGTWQVSTVVVYDVVGNSRAYHTAELQAAGFPTTVTVTR